MSCAQLLRKSKGMKKALLLVLAGVLSACGSAEPRLPTTTQAAAAVALAPAPKVPSYNPLSTTHGMLVTFGADLMITNHAPEKQEVCANTRCAQVLPGETRSLTVDPARLERLIIGGAEFTFDATGTLARPAGKARITTRRITTAVTGAPTLVGDNLPGGGERWPDRPEQLLQLVVETY